jgi:S-adenosylmethionine:tRNA ribosyltransferase-isomerase
MPAPAIRISDYTYDLPAHRIALYPLADRDTSRLLVYRAGEISSHHYCDLAAHLPEHSLLVMNDTRVIHARLLFTKTTGSVIEVFCLEPDARYADITTGMAQTHEVYWRCLVGKAAKWKEQMLHLTTTDGSISLCASIHSRDEQGYVIHLSWGTGATFAEVLQVLGAVPLPPYIHRTATTLDTSSYQTVYAAHDGSVAAPTAGLHITPRVLDSLATRHIDRSYLTLHVGAGTFLPVKVDDVRDHVMHAEWLEVSRATIQQISDTLQAGLPITAVGTTSLRTLESLYWLGIKVTQQPHIAPIQIHLGQWEVYDLSATSPASEMIAALLAWMNRQGIDRLTARTQILIVPGYSFKMVDRLVTNFHQPNSTLLLLIAAFIGRDWRRLYAYALAHDYRFLSYGDGSLLVR